MFSYRFLKNAVRICFIGNFALLLSVSSPPVAQAATTTGSFSVTATVLGVCTVGATTLAFGNYTPSNGTPNDAGSTVNVTCNNGSAYTIALDAGATAGATVAARAMTSGANSLSYALYTTAGRTTVWGDGALSTVTQGGTGSGAQQNFTVYGRIPVNQYVPAGSYSDTVTVTLTY
jgi:spore coat protein U-like protein